MQFVHDMLLLSLLPWVVFMVKDLPVRSYMEGCGVCVFEVKKFLKKFKKTCVGLFTFQIQQILGHLSLITLILIPVGRLKSVHINVRDNA